jgi:hypothetical protein
LRAAATERSRMSDRARVKEGEQRPARPDEMCRCGRPATVVIGNRWGGAGWCGTEDPGPVDSPSQEQARGALQLELGRPLRRSDLPEPLPHSFAGDQDDRLDMDLDPYPDSGVY